MKRRYWQQGQDQGKAGRAPRCKIEERDHPQGCASLGSLPLTKSIPYQEILDIHGHCREPSSRALGSHLPFGYSACPQQQGAESLVRELSSQTKRTWFLWWWQPMAVTQVGEACGCLLLLRWHDGPVVKSTGLEPDYRVHVPALPHARSSLAPLSAVCLVTQSCLTLCDCMDWPARLLCPWDSPGKNTGVGLCALLWGNLPSAGIQPESLMSPALAGRFFLSHQGNPRILEWVAYPFSRGSSWPRNCTSVSCIAGRFFRGWANWEAPL